MLEEILTLLIGSQNRGRQKADADEKSIALIHHDIFVSMQGKEFTYTDLILRKNQTTRIRALYCSLR
jgi:hypothetical protein